MSNLPAFSAVIAAAGVGRRFGAAIPKQYLPLAGRTVLEHSVARLLEQPSLDRLVLVVAERDRHWRSLTLLEDPRVRVVTGGMERSDSVLAGLTELARYEEHSSWVLVHDVARPCLPERDLYRLLSELAQEPVGGLLALPVADTVKQVREGVVVTTLDRRALWRAQTPQMFRLGLLRQALTDALAAGIAVTDEASALEWAGHAPRVVVGSPANIKITQPEDLALATFYLQSHQVQPQERSDFKPEQRSDFKPEQRSDPIAEQRSDLKSEQTSDFKPLQRSDSEPEQQSDPEPKQRSSSGLQQRSGPTRQGPANPKPTDQDDPLNLKQKGGEP